MANWDDVDVDVGGDETINFGPRVEAGSALYQVDTVATVSATGKVTGIPEVHSCVHDESFCLAADSNLTLFDNGCHKLIHTLPFGSTIDCMAHCGDADFLVVGERDGHVHFVDPNVDKPIFTKKLTSEDDTQDSATFLHIAAVLAEEETCDVLVLIASGKVAYFTNLQLLALRKALESRDAVLAKDIHAQVRMMVIDTTTVHQDGIEFVAHLPSTLGRSVITAGIGTAVLAVWEEQNGQMQLAQSASSLLTSEACIMKCLPVQGSKFLLCLDDNDILSLWSSTMLSLVRRWTDRAVSQFLLLETGDVNNNLCETQVALLTKPTGGLCTLQICSLPRLDVIYQLELSGFTWLSECPAHQESVFIVEGVEDDQQTHEGLLSTLRIRSLTEALPETRFNRLLHKNRFEEAEQFAKLFDLDIELVYKVKANDLIDQLSPWNADQLNEEETSGKLEELRNCLEQIKDDSHLVESCVRSAMPTLEFTLELMTMARNRLNESIAGMTKADQKLAKQALLTRVLETLHRLGTFQVAFGADSFTGTRWEHFQKCNMLEELLRHLELGQLGEAFSIWNRHQSEFDEVFSVEVVEEVLASVPESIPADDLKQWLRKDFIPYIISVLPDGLSLVAAWLEQRARNMEILEKHGWPKNALEFCELLQSTCVSMSQAASERGFATADEFATQMCNLSVGYSQVEKSEVDSEDGDRDAFVSLHLLVLQLRDLINLHSKYHCRLSLAEYVQETTESLTYCMLDHVVALELIPSTIDSVIRPYMKEHGLNEDKMLFQYIGDLTRRLGSTTAAVGEAPWEAKAIIVIGCIKNTEYKCCAILDAMRTAYVPWSTDMQALVKEGLALDHPSVEKLKNQCQLMELQKLLANYNLRGYYVADTITAETLVYHILSQDRPSALEDALEVIKAFNQLDDLVAYMFRLQFLINHNKVPESVDLLRSMPEKLALECGRRLVINTLLQLNKSLVFEQEVLRSSILLQSRATCAILKYLLSLKIDQQFVEEFQMTLNDLSNIHALQMEFGEFVTHRDYHQEDFRKKFLVRHLRMFYSKQGKDVKCSQNGTDPDRNPNRKQTWSYTKIYRLSQLLQIPLDTLRGQLAVTAAEQGEVDTAIKKAKELYIYLPNAETGRVLYTVAHTLCQRLAGKHTPSSSHRNIREISAAIHELASKALAVCEPALVADCLTLCKTTDLAHTVCRQCESGDYGLTVQRAPPSQQDLSSLDPYESWTFDILYQEDGLVMDSAVVTPLAYQYTLAVLQGTGVLKMPFSQNRIQGRLPEDKAGARKKNQTASAGPLQPLKKCTDQLMEYLGENRHLEISLHYQMHSLGCKTQSSCLARKGHPEPWTAELSEQLTGLLWKMFNQKHADLKLALGYLCCLREIPAFNTLKEMVEGTTNSHRRMLALSRLGREFSQLCEKQDSFFEALHTNAYWGYTLAKYKIPFKNVDSKEAKLKVLLSMVANSSVTLTLVKEYCSCRGLEENEALHSYLHHLLVPSGHRGEGEGQIDGSLTPQMIERATTCIQSLHQYAGLWEDLDGILHQLDLYDYERQSFVLEQMKAIKSEPTILKKLELLHYLKLYKRVAPPGQHELEYRAVSEEEEIMYGSHALSPLAKTRLPYHPLTQGEPWKIISPELNVDTLPSLLSIADILQLSRDQVYLTAIQNVVKKYVETKAAGSSSAMSGHSATQSGGGPDKTSCNWHSDDQQTTKFFQTVARMLLKVSNCEMAVVCGNWIVKTLPMGSEKVLALNAVVTLATKWLEACPPGESAEKEKAQATLEKFTNICRRLSTEQILFQHNLGQQSLLRLCNKPSKLLLSLYGHDSILKRVAGTSIVESLPDIHVVAERVAEIYGISVEKICLALVDKWLPSCHQNKQDLDSTISLAPNMNMLDMTVRSEDEISEDEVNLKRVTYILQHGQLDRNALFLLNFAFHKPSNKVTNVCRVRAIRCLFSLVDKPIIEKLAHMSVETIREYMKTWLYLVELDRLHVPETVKSFGKCNKEGLVRGIWRNHSHEKRAVRLVADLCLDYEIYDVQLWNSMLQQLLAFQMMEYLRHVLVCLSGVPTLWQVDCIQRMWSTVLEQPLLAAVPPLSESQLEECLSSFVLLHRCPMLLDLNLLSFSQRFQKLEITVAALGCVLLLPDGATRQEQVCEILKPGVHRTILCQLDEWLKAGRKLPIVDQMKHAVYHHLNKTEQFGTIGEKHLAALASYLAEQDQIDKLLIHGLKNNRLPQAVHLVSAYRNLHPDSEFAQAISQTKPEPSPLKQLRMFLETRNLLENLKDHLPQQLLEDEEEEEMEEEEEVTFNMTYESGLINGY